MLFTYKYTNGSNKHAPFSSGNDSNGSSRTKVFKLCPLRGLSLILQNIVDGSAFCLSVCKMDDSHISNLSLIY